MTTNVSRESNAKPCSGCGQPRDRKGQRYCTRCHREYMINRRNGRTEMLLTPAERQVILAMRRNAAEPALAAYYGRHTR